MTQTTLFRGQKQTIHLKKKNENNSHNCKLPFKKFIFFSQWPTSRAAQLRRSQRYDVVSISQSHPSPPLQSLTTPFSNHKKPTSDLKYLIILMANAQSFSLISFHFLIPMISIFSLSVSSRHSIPNCPKTNTSVINFTSEFVMCQHQVRGSFSVINDCAFKVKDFDMINGGSDVYWWGAVGDSYKNLTNGYVISDEKLNATSYKNESFIVKLSKNVTWDDVKVVAVWKKSLESDFGHVVLEEKTDSPTSPAPSPAPSDVKFNGSSVVKVVGEPTMFDNCKVLSDKYRLRWTVRLENNVIDIGLEGAIDIRDYMAFGWADPFKENDHMLGADVAVTGFTEKGHPFVDDYHITKYSECMTNKNGKAEGVCPDTMYVESDDRRERDLVNNTMLVYGHRKDGVSFIRYQRPLKSIDKRYDWNINVKKNMTCIWALGFIKPPDSIRPNYLPENHGKTYGHVHINVSERVNDCLGPLDNKNKQDQELVIADEMEPLVVTSGPGLHYPNPPNPSKVLYINKKESPLLRVERGVPVKFSIQAGHNVAFYITSDPLGGNVTSRNRSETIYAGGPKAHGVKSKPKVLEWAPNRNTPGQVYYQSFFTQKMGWKVQVVDGGLTDMYNNSVLLDDQQVSFFWTLSKKSISIAARGEKKSGYLAIGFGSKMVNSFAYVGWVDANGKGHVKTYWIDGMNAQSLHPTKEHLTYVRCKSERGIITMEFTRPLDPNCDGDKKIECKNIVEPTSPFPIIWAMGAKWSSDHLTQSNMHSVTSNKPVRVSLIYGSAEVEEDLRPVLAVHGFMMFLAWGMFLPCGILAARYMKHVDGDVWFKIHVYTQWSGLTITFLGILFAAAELRGLHINLLHVKIGILTVILGCIQPINAYIRPKKGDVGEEPSPQRIFWEYIHAYCGRLAVFVGVFAIFSGMKHLGDRYDDDNVRGLMRALVVWILAGVLTVLYLEYRRKRHLRQRIFGLGNWVLGDDVDEETDLLRRDRIHGVNVDKLALPSERSEIQLEPLST
ncbi:putative DOMON domain, cytochrome b561/ferric reductase transmembrane, DM13 [Helianthus annuus]|nr:putative DOMON domain, cytochrome b561/ferric reductase transmembrane, DM13 [Helianthus annuus]